MPLQSTRDNTKSQILDEIARFTPTHPELAELYTKGDDGLDSELTKRELINLANDVLAKGKVMIGGPPKAEATTAPSDEAASSDEVAKPITKDNDLSDSEKADAFAKLVEEKPEALLVPTREAYLGVVNPNRSPRARRDMFVMTLMAGRMGNVAVDPYRAWERTEEERSEDTQPVPDGTPVTSAPHWAYTKLYDLIDQGEVRVFEDRDAVVAYDWGPKNPNEGILATGGGDVEIGLTEIDTGFNEPGLILQPIGRFTRTEQACAYNVLNEEVRGEAPMPDEPAADPLNITDEEYNLVEKRILDCLENPGRYTDLQISPKTFDEVEFFTALIKYELKGRNPIRPGRVAAHGQTRPRIVRLIREICKDRGLQVVGNYVRHAPPAQDSGIELVPRGPLRGQLYQ